MHLIDNLVLGVGKGFEVVVDGCPSPSTAVGVSFDEYVLAVCTGTTDTVDGGLVEAEDEGLLVLVWQSFISLLTQCLPGPCRGT